jgi:hypothetical protein
MDMTTYQGQTIPGGCVWTSQYMVWRSMLLVPRTLLFCSLKNDHNGQHTPQPHDWTSLQF